MKGSRVICKRCGNEGPGHYDKWCSECLNEITDRTDALVLKFREDLKAPLDDAEIGALLQMFASDMDDILKPKSS